MDKSPWDSTAIFISFCDPFRNYLAVLPPSPTLYKVETRKNSGYTRPALFVGRGKGLDMCELENVPEMQKCPQTFVHDCSHYDTWRRIISSLLTDNPPSQERLATPDHQGLRLLLFSNSGVGSFTPHKNQINGSAVGRYLRFFVLIRED